MTCFTSPERAEIDLSVRPGKSASADCVTATAWTRRKLESNARPLKRPVGGPPREARRYHANLSHFDFRDHRGRLAP
jgi:hypothetical protein